MIQEVIKLKNTEPVHIMRKNRRNPCCNETDEFDNDSERIMIERSTMFGNLTKKYQKIIKPVKQELRRRSSDMSNYIEFEDREASQILTHAILNTSSDDHKKLWPSIKALR